MDPQNVQRTLNERITVLEERWGKYSNPLKESFKRRGKTLDPASWAATLQGMENIHEKFATMSEATLSANIGSFVQHGYDLITAVYPNLIANQIASIQPLQYKVGEIWFMELQYEAAKGLTGANTVALSGVSGARPEKYYSSEYIDGVSVQTPNSVLTDFSGTTGVAIKTGAQLDFIYITDGVETFRPDPTNYAVLIGDAGGTGTLNLSTGAWAVSFAAAVTTGNVVKAIGRVNTEANPSSIGKTKINFTSSSIEAKKHQLVSTYSMDAEYELKKQFNRDMNDELVKANGSLIKAEIDSLVIDDMKIAAKSAEGAGFSTWDGAFSGVSELDHFRTFLTVLQKQSQDINDKTRMVRGNFVVAGSNLCTVLTVLPEFKSAVTPSSESAGPHVLGTVNGLLIIKHPDFDANEWIMGNKGASAFHTGYVFAPYMPLMVTPPVSSPDSVFDVTRGLFTQAGRKVVNPRYYAHGVATNLFA